MKLLKIVLLSILFLNIALFSCKRKYEGEFIGPIKEANFTLKEPLELSTSSIDFADNDTNLVYFAAKVDRATDITVTIRGLESNAQKTITYKNVSKLDSTNTWNGSQDELYYFRTGEKCVVTISAGGNLQDNEIAVQLRDRGEVVSGGTILDTDTLVIKRRRNLPSNQIELFPRYPIFTESTQERGYNLVYKARYDHEDGAGDRNDKERAPELATIIRNGNRTIEHISTNTELLEFDPYKKSIRGTDGDRFFLLKGKDQISKVTPYNSPDYYIGRLSSPNMKGNANIAGNILAYGNGINQTKSIVQAIEAVSPDDLYFNVFVYGNGDGSQINYTIKEVENTIATADYDDKIDESYQTTIKVNFKGWQLFSIPYSKFTYTRQKNEVTGKEYDGSKANKVKEPGKIRYVQFSLVAGTLGGEGQAIIDCPVMSWGGPLKY